MHPSYYLSAHCCILCFDMTRKITYKNLDTWYDELVSHRGTVVPVVVVANKVDMDPARAKKSFGFVERRRAERLAAAAATATSRPVSAMTHSFGERERGLDGSAASLASMGKDEEEMPMFLCSASDGTNVVSAFKEAIRRAVRYKEVTSVLARGSSVNNSVSSSSGKGAAGMFVDEVLDFLREEESRPDGGVFGRRKDEVHEDV
jgi:GTPase SAR1 family protein